MVYSYNKSQQDALFLYFILVKNFMFQKDLVSIIRSLNAVFTAIAICHTSEVGMEQFHSDLTSRQST